MKTLPKIFREKILYITQDTGDKIFKIDKIQKIAEQIVESGQWV